MFVILLSYTHGLELIDQHLSAHRAFLDKYYQLGNFICSGPQNPRTGGVILCKASCKEAVELLIQEDPFYIYQAATYQIVEFEPLKYAPDFSCFI
jgi:uncharacterized protein YciI